MKYKKVLNRRPYGTNDTMESHFDLEFNINSNGSIPL